MLFFVLIIPFLCNLASSAHIGLFASTGAYSHDMLMRNLADRLSAEESHTVTIIQIRVYEFNRTMPSPRAHWEYVSFNSTDEASLSLQRQSQRMMWLVTLPFDEDKFDLHSWRMLDNIHSQHMRACFRALRDPGFIREINRLNLDLLVIDYILNECALGIASLLRNKIQLVYMSNYPIVSCYVDNMGVSSNPAYVPAVIGAEKLPMSVSRRTFNSFLYILLLGTRRRFYWSAKRTFKLASNIDLPGLSKFERRIIMFATPFEMLLDVPRPLVTGLRYFGCEHCTEATVKGNITKLLGLPPTTKGFILVSFGTITKGDLIPIEQLIRLFRAFAKFPQYTIVWQLDATREYFERAVLKSMNATQLPNHIHLFPWIPLRSLLTDPRVVLLVSHGGVTTCIEAVNSGVPVLGVAIQGDQLYNLQRFVEKGVGEFLQVSKLNEQVLIEKLSIMIRENLRYKNAALKLRSMLNDYKTLEKKPPSRFWLNWAVRHFGKNLNETNRKSTLSVRLIASKHHSNWLVHYNFEIFFVFGTIIGLITHLTLVIS